MTAPTNSSIVCVRLPTTGSRDPESAKASAILMPFRAEPTLPTLWNVGPSSRIEAHALLGSFNLESVCRGAHEVAPARRRIIRHDSQSDKHRSAFAPYSLGRRLGDPDRSDGEAGKDRRQTFHALSFLGLGRFGCGSLPNCGGVGLAHARRDLIQSGLGARFVILASGRPGHSDGTDHLVPCHDR